MNKNEAKEKMMQRSYEMIEAIVDEIGIDSASQWIECLYLNMLCIADVPLDEVPQYFKNMQQLYMSLRNVNDERVLN